MKRGLLKWYLSTGNNGLLICVPFNGEQWTLNLGQMEYLLYFSLSIYRCVVDPRHTNLLVLIHLKLLSDSFTYIRLLLRAAKQ